jgi:hypothetical protein
VFRGLHARTGQLREHHRSTLDRIAGLCAAPRTAGSLVTEVFPRATSGLHYLLGFGETRAHLVHLARAGRVVEREENGRVLYTNHSS